MQIFAIPCIGWFGMTETVAMPIVSLEGLPGREAAIGLPAPEYGIEVRRDEGGDVAFGESGTMWLKGVPGLSLFLEYLNDPDATAAAFDAGGWFLTGDRVTPFEDGYIRFDGRNKDMLRIGAENVAESEIERVIMGAGGVIEVAVVGRPHEMLDEVPVAFVLPLAPDPALPRAHRGRVPRQARRLQAPARDRHRRRIPRASRSERSTRRRCGRGWRRRSRTLACPIRFEGRGKHDARWQGLVGDGRVVRHRHGAGRRFGRSRRAAHPFGTKRGGSGCGVQAPRQRIARPAV